MGTRPQWGANGHPAQSPRHGAQCKARAEAPQPPSPAPRLWPQLPGLPLCLPTVCASFTRRGWARGRGLWEVPTQSLGGLCLVHFPGGKEVTVVATDYETSSIMNTVFHKGGKAHSVLKLHSEPTGESLLCLCPVPAQRGGRRGLGGGWGGRDRQGKGQDREGDGVGQKGAQDRAGSVSVAPVSACAPQPAAALPRRPDGGTRRKSRGQVPRKGRGAWAVSRGCAAALQGL